MDIRENVMLGPLTTLGVGGPARWFVAAKSEDDVRSALDFSRDRKLPIFVLGGGSNLVVSDAGFNGLVLKMEIGGIDVTDERDRQSFDVGAGEEWDKLVAITVEHDCAGMECLSGIPGTVGGTPVQNVGAYGQDVSETITGVRAICVADGSAHEFTNGDCGFKYRTSRFNGVDRGRYIITRVKFALKAHGLPKIEYADLKRAFAAHDGSPSLQQVREAVMRIRHEKAMLIVDGDPDSRSAGSFFRNPVIEQSHYDKIAAAAGVSVPKYPASDGHVKVPAGWLIEQAGIHKGFALGNVGISRRHALAIVNRGEASAAEVFALQALIQDKVRAKFDIELQPEPVFL